ncbi:putative DNA-directed RNA polymerase beta subunit 1 [Salmonella phage STsAS]|nr:putative DNA-directed RNA polymerase beta subunit 1 [Salmonella phage STsAS]
MVQNRIIDEELNSAPVCSLDCKAPIAHRYNLGRKCPTCGYVVTEHRIESDVWLRAPDEMGNFVNPRFWALFNAFFNGKLKKFDRNKVTIERGPDLMMWMIDPYYRCDEPDGKRAHAVKRILEEHQYVRGIRNLVDHHKTIFQILTSPEAWKEIYAPNRHNADEGERLRLQWKRLFETQSRAFFPKHLPLISSKLIVTEEGRRGVMVDPVFTGAIDAVKNIALLYTRRKPVEARFLTSRAIKANRQLAYFYVDFRRESMEGKPGDYRAKVGSTHIPFGGRATISPISEPHDAWKLKAPWRWMVGLMSVDLESKLLDRGYSARQCERIVAKAAMQYDPLVDELFKELIAETPGGLGIMVEPLRNPTLVQLSVQTLYIDEVVTDVNQCSLRISDRVIKMANGDFDGDQFQVRRPIDQTEMDLALQYRPDNGFMSSTDVDRVEHGMVLHNELISMQNQFLIEAGEETSEDEEEGIPLDSVRTPVRV